MHGHCNDLLAFLKQLIPDAFSAPQLPIASGFESWLRTLITKVHAAAQVLDSAREWKAKVKHDPDFDKYESVTKRLNILVAQKDRTLELTN